MQGCGWAIQRVLGTRRRQMLIRLACKLSNAGMQCNRPSNLTRQLTRACNGDELPHCPSQLTSRSLMPLNSAGCGPSTRAPSACSICGSRGRAGASTSLGTGAATAAGPNPRERDGRAAHLAVVMSNRGFPRLDACWCRKKVRVPGGACRAVGQSAHLAVGHVHVELPCGGRVGGVAARRLGRRVRRRVLDGAVSRPHLRASVHGVPTVGLRCTEAYRRSRGWAELPRLLPQTARTGVHVQPAPQAAQPCMMV